MNNHFNNTIYNISIIENISSIVASIKVISISLNSGLVVSCCVSVLLLNK